MEYNKKQRIYKTIMLVILTIIITVIATTIGLYRYWGTNKNIKYVMLPTSDKGLSAEISRLRTVIDKYYLGEIDDQKLEDGALVGYISGLGDEYSEYIPKEQMEDFKADTTGNYNGIGIYYGRLSEDGRLVVIAPIKESPAYKAGILPGDIIVKINNEEIAEDTSLTDISNKIKGEVGTSVNLTIQRGEETKEFSIKRENIKLHYIDTKILNNEIGYMDILTFDEGTSEDFANKYEELKSQGIKSLIIDLRNNGGGIVQEATGIADRILKKDSTILITKDKDGKEEITKAQTDNSIDLPIIILTNNNTASASEILTGALRDNNVAKVVGETTFGKGVIQNVFTLSTGAGLKLTTNEYFTPNNNKINHVGIEPDEKVDVAEEYRNKMIIPEDQDTQLKKAIEMLQN